MSTTVLLIIIAVTLLLLVRGADSLVEGASSLAFQLGMPKVIVGATIVSLGTTSPEAAVSVLAAWEGKPGLALGNAVGSIIADTALIFGLCAVMTRVPADPFVLQRQGWLQFGSAALLAGLCYWAAFRDADAASLGRGVGALLLLLLAGYLFLSVIWSQRYPTVFDETEGRTVRSTTRSLLMVVGGLAVVALASQALIDAVSELAVRLGVPSVVIAATLVAFGTSLPELIVGLTAVRQGHAELLVGNVVGADILNVLFVIGASAVAAPLPIIDHASTMPNLFLALHLPVMLGVLLLFRAYIYLAVRSGSFSRWMGAPLLLVYATYVVVQFALTRQ